MSMHEILVKSATIYYLGVPFFLPLINIINFY